MSTRGKGDFMTEAEIETLRAAFRADRDPGDVAAELRCSRRSVTRYYAMFRGSPQKLGRPKYREPIRAVRAVPLPSRFYKSNFEL